MAIRMARAAVSPPAGRLRSTSAARSLACCGPRRRAASGRRGDAGRRGRRRRPSTGAGGPDGGSVGGTPGVAMTAGPEAGRGRRRRRSGRRRRRRSQAASTPSESPAWPRAGRRRARTAPGGAGRVAERDRGAERGGLRARASGARGQGAGERVARRARRPASGSPEPAPGRRTAAPTGQGRPGAAGAPTSAGQRIAMRRCRRLLLRDRSAVLVVLHDRPARARRARRAAGVDLLLHLVELGLRLLGELLGLVEEPHAATASAKGPPVPRARAAGRAEPAQDSGLAWALLACPPTGRRPQAAPRRRAA